MQTTLTGIDIEKQFKKLKSKVVYALDKYPSTKGRDILLIYYIWRDFYGVRIEFNKFEELLSLVSPYNIQRCRQLINTKGVRMPDGRTEYYRPRPETTSKRRALANNLRELFGRGAI